MLPGMSAQGLGLRADPAVRHQRESHSRLHLCEHYTLMAPSKAAPSGYHCHLVATSDQMS